MSDQLIPADPRARRRWAALGVGLPLLILFGLTAVGLPDADLPTKEFRAAVDRHSVTTSALLGALGLPMLAASIYFATIARKAHQSRRFPPAGHPLPYPVVARSGSRVRGMVIAYTFLALTSFAAGALVVFAALQGLP